MLHYHIDMTYLCRWSSTGQRN